MKYLNDFETYNLNFIATAFYVECKEKQMKLNANLSIRSKYIDLSIFLELIGDLVLKLDKYSEEYIISLPNCHVRCLLTKPLIELNDKCFITCKQTGYYALIEFSVCYLF